MTVTVPPRSPAIESDRDLEQRVTDLEALIEEARRRARRRRRAYAALLLAALGAAAWAAFGIGGSGRAPLGRSVAGGPPRALAAQTSPGGWQPLHGPEGGDVFAIAIDPADSKIVYAGGWGNVFKSSDGGGSWKDVTNEPWTRVAVLAIDPAHPGVVYAGTDRGVGKTTDGGRHWRMVNSGLFDGRAALRPRVARLDESAVWSLTIAARHPSTVYATTALGLYRTTNGGKRWQIIGPAFSEMLSARDARSPLRLRTRRRDRPERRADHLRELDAWRRFAHALQKQRRWDELAADHNARHALVLGARLHGLGRAPRNRRVAPRRVQEHGRRHDLEPFRRAGERRSTGSRWIPEAARSTGKRAGRCSRRQTAETAGSPPRPTSPMARS